MTGAEFASAYDALGSQVVLVSSRDRVLPGEDADAAQVLEDVFARRGLTVLSRSRAESVVREGDGVVVTLTDGRQLTKEVEFPRGHAGNPMTDSEVEVKFRALVEPRYGRQTADAVLEKCWKFEELTNVADVLGLLGDR